VSGRGDMMSLPRAMVIMTTDFRSHFADRFIK
jgi:hypothetical protein